VTWAAGLARGGRRLPNDVIDNVGDHAAASACSDVCRNTLTRLAITGFVEHVEDRDPVAQGVLDTTISTVRHVNRCPGQQFVIRQICGGAGVGR
jgi:hypothetical protein